MSPRIIVNYHVVLVFVKLPKLTLWTVGFISELITRKYFADAFGIGGYRVCKIKCSAK